MKLINDLLEHFGLRKLSSESKLKSKPKKKGGKK